MSLGKIIVQLSNPDAWLELKPSEDDAYLTVTRVIRGEEFITKLLTEVILKERDAAASVQGSQIRELVEFITADPNRGLTENERGLIDTLLPELLARTVVLSRGAPYFQEKDQISISYRDAKVPFINGVVVQSVYYRHTQDSHSSA